MAGRVLPGAATPRAVVAIVGDRYEVQSGDVRQVAWRSVGEPGEIPSELAAGGIHR
jgi:hypothetical protein